MNGATRRLVLLHCWGRGRPVPAMRPQQHHLSSVAIPAGVGDGRSDRLLRQRRDAVSRLPLSTAGMQMQQRYFGTGSRRRRECPFRVLGVSEGVDYGTVKRSFLKLAMTHHPDTAVSGDDEEGDDAEAKKREAVELFMRVRDAFDAIVELDDGSAALKAEHEADGHGMSGEEFDHWFYEETGHHSPNPFDLNLDQATLREVAESQDLAGGGELDRGGMWAMASMVTRGLNGPALGPQLRLEQGDVTMTSADGKKKIRRRRRR